MAPHDQFAIRAESARVSAETRASRMCPSTSSSELGAMGVLGPDDGQGAVDESRHHKCASCRFLYYDPSILDISSNCEVDNSRTAADLLSLSWTSFPVRDQPLLSLWQGGRHRPNFLAEGRCLKMFEFPSSSLQHGHPVLSCRTRSSISAIGGVVSEKVFMALLHPIFWREGFTTSRRHERSTSQSPTVGASSLW